MAWAAGAPVFNVSNMPADAGTDLKRLVVGSNLILPGSCLDHVIEAYLPMEDSLTGGIISDLFDLYLALDHTYDPTSQPRWEVIWRTMIADTGEGPLAAHLAPPEYADHFRAWFLETSATSLTKLNGEEADLY